MVGNIIYPISVSKSYKRRGRGIKHKDSTKKIWFVYGYDKDGNFGSEQVSMLEAIKAKLNRYYKRTFFCPKCRNYFEGLVRKGTKKVKCPYCN